MGFRQHAWKLGFTHLWEYSLIIYNFSGLKTCRFSCVTLQGHTSLTKRDDVRSQQRSEEILAVLLRLHVIGHVTSGCEPAAAVHALLQGWGQQRHMCKFCFVA